MTSLKVLSKTQMNSYQFPALALLPAEVFAGYYETWSSHWDAKVAEVILPLSLSLPSCATPVFMGLPLILPSHVTLNPRSFLPSPS